MHCNNLDLLNLYININKIHCTVPLSCMIAYNSTPRLSLGKLGGDGV